MAAAVPERGAGELDEAEVFDGIFGHPIELRLEPRPLP